MARLTQAQLDQAARRFYRLAQAHAVPFAFAESCTGGLLAATLTRIPGVSELFCGSAVVYQEHTKTAWLGVSPRLLKRHGAVSPQVAQAMARLVLLHTPRAQLAIATTGHLGPQAPEELDGVLYVGLGWRKQPGGTDVCFHRVELFPSRESHSPRQLRLLRQRQAVQQALELGTQWLLGQMD